MNMMDPAMLLKEKTKDLDFRGGIAAIHPGLSLPAMAPQEFYQEDPMMGFDEDEMYAEYDSPLPDLQVPEDEYLFDDDIPEDEFTDEHLANIESLLDQFESSNNVSEEDEQMSDPSMEFDQDYM
ncbi:hypothetical protein N8654_03200 [Synechococcus sp. AH-601-B19]|nr:hypothetical protein [Synechococcus sp. AH-601-B19]